jgi:hypothetical protein
MSNWKAVEAGVSVEDVSRATNKIEAETEQGERQNQNSGDLEKIKSSSGRSNVIDPFAEPPDGGLNAWLKVLGCFLIYSNICLSYLSLNFTFVFEC